MKRGGGERTSRKSETRRSPQKAFAISHGRQETLEVLTSLFSTLTVVIFVSSNELYSNFRIFSSSTTQLIPLKSRTRLAATKQLRQIIDLSSEFQSSAFVFNCLQSVSSSSSSSSRLMQSISFARTAPNRT